MTRILHQSMTRRLLRAGGDIICRAARGVGSWLRRRSVDGPDVYELGIYDLGPYPIPLCLIIFVPMA
jgi:hypothetical protein